MRLGLGVFVLVASMVAAVTASATLPLTLTPLLKLSGVTLADVFANALGVAFCWLAVVFGALMVVSDDMIALGGYCVSAAFAAILAGMLVAGPLVLALAFVLGFAVRPRRNVVRSASPHTSRPVHLRAVPAEHEADGSLPRWQAERSLRPSRASGT